MRNEMGAVRAGLAVVRGFNRATLEAIDPEPCTPLVFRIVSRSMHGTVSLKNGAALHRPDTGSTGQDDFT